MLFSIGEIKKNKFCVSFSFLPFSFFPCKKNKKMENEFSLACRDGNADKVKRMIRQHKLLNVNTKSFNGFTPLEMACSAGHSRVVILLLNHPIIEINITTVGGSTVFIDALRAGHLGCVEAMFADSRVDINKPCSLGHTALWYAAKDGLHSMIVSWIISGRKMNVEKATNAKDFSGDRKTKGNTVLLLQRCQNNLEEVRHELRMEERWYDRTAANLFALIVFLCDGLLEIKITSNILFDRFFQIARKLPLDIQMVLCHRVACSMKNNITQKYSEPAFRNLANLLLS
jgi:hypothetical protein